MELEICKVAPRAWDRRSIASVCSRVTSGGTPSRTDPSYYSGAIPWVKTKELLDGWIEETEEHISELALAESSAKLLKPQSILMAMYGATVGHLGLLRREAACNQAACAMEINERIASFQYLYYQLLVHRSQIKSLATGAAQQNLSAATIKSFVLPFPPVEEQREIGRILAALDEKIALNRQTSHALEELALDIFQTWFVKFLPTRAKVAACAEGRDPLRAAMCVLSGQDEAGLEAMPREHFEQLAATAALFPDKLVDSDVGEIPEGWSPIPVGKVLESTIGGDWGVDAPDGVHTAAVRILRGTDLPRVASGNDDAVPLRYVDPAKLTRRSLLDGDLVLEVSGGSKSQPTGRTLYVTDRILKRLGEIVEPASFCRRLRPKSKEQGLLLAHYMRHIYANGKTWLYQNQSTGISNFQVSVFLEKEIIVLPQHPATVAFYQFVRPMLDRMHSAETPTLITLRDTLLPKLLSGKIRVGEAWELVEAVA